MNFPIRNGLTILLAHACIYSRFCVICFWDVAIPLVSTSWGKLLVSYLFALTFFKVELVFSNDNFCCDQTLNIGHRNVAGKTPLFNPCSKLRQNEQGETELFELTHDLKYIFFFYYIYVKQ